MTTLAIAQPTSNTARKLAAALLGAALLALPGMATAQSGSAERNGGITVTGSGVAYGEPDRAVINLGVDAVAESVREALEQADATMNLVREAALALGVEQRQIRTNSFNVWRQQLTDQSGQPTGERYHVQHSFQISVDDTDLVGQLLADAIEAGANDVGGISFTISDTAALQSQAREAAMEDARNRATQLAQLAGLELGQVISVEETSYNAPLAAANVQYARAASTPIETGELAVNVSVKVIFAVGGPTE